MLAAGCFWSEAFNNSDFYTRPSIAVVIFVSSIINKIDIK